MYTVTHTVIVKWRVKLEKYNMTWNTQILCQATTIILIDRGICKNKYASNCPQYVQATVKKLTASLVKFVYVERVWRSQTCKISSLVIELNFYSLYLIKKGISSTWCFTDSKFPDLTLVTASAKKTKIVFYGITSLEIFFD